MLAASGCRSLYITVTVACLAYPATLCAADDASDASEDGVVIASVDSKALFRAMGLEAPRGHPVPDGISYYFPHRGPVQMITVGVFPDADSARPRGTRDEWGNFTGPPLPSESLDGGPGDVRWRERNGQVWFRRANVLCRIYPGSADDRALMEMAQAIDDLLVSSDDIAPKAERVVVPRITVTPLDDPREGTRLRLRFEVVDGSPVLSPYSQGEPVMSGTMTVPCYEPGEQSAVIALATEMNVVATTTFTFTVLEPEEEDDGG